MSQINIRLDDEQKKDWQQYVSESDSVQNLTQLIKAGVALYIETDGGTEALDTPNPGLGVGADDIDLEYIGQVATRLEHIQGNLEDIDDKIETLDSEVQGVFDLNYDLILALSELDRSDLDGIDTFLDERHVEGGDDE